MARHVSLAMYAYEIHSFLAYNPDLEYLKTFEMPFNIGEGFKTGCSPDSKAEETNAVTAHYGIVDGQVCELSIFAEFSLHKEVDIKLDENLLSSLLAMDFSKA